jgi:hypothetical protein
MRNISKNLWNPATGSSLYCVWAPVHDAGTDTDRLEAIWLERGPTAFKSCVAETSDGNAVATHFAGHQEGDADQSAGEDLASMLPHHC